MLTLAVLALLPAAAAFSAPMAAPLRRVQVAPAGANVQMINLFGNSEQSKKQRDALSLRDAPAGSRRVSFRKPNQATTGLTLGLKFRESFGKAVYIDQILPNTEAARLEKAGKLKKGDEVVMVSATFGNEMWSARGIGKYRLEKSIAVRQGMTIDFVLESSDDQNKAARKKEAERAKAEAEKMSRLQAQLTKEVEEDKKEFSQNPFKFW